MQYERRLGLYAKDALNGTNLQARAKVLEKIFVSNELAWYFRCHFVSKYSWALFSPLHYIHKNSEIEHDNSSDKMTIGLKFPKYEHKHALGLKYIVPAQFWLKR